MNKTELRFDASKFLGDFGRITKTDIPDRAKKGLFQLGWIIIRDANEKPPMTPRKIGDLQSSGKVFIEKLKLIVGFNRAYAAKWHEAIKKKINWTVSNKCPSPGPKFLENKLSMYKNDYIKFVSKFIRR